MGSPDRFPCNYPRRQPQVHKVDTALTCSFNVLRPREKSPPEAWLIWRPRIIRMASSSIAWILRALIPLPCGLVQIITTNTTTCQINVWRCLRPKPSLVHRIKYKCGIHSSGRLQAAHTRITNTFRPLVHTKSIYEERLRQLWDRKHSLFVLTGARCPQSTSLDILLYFS